MDSIIRSYKPIYFGIKELVCKYIFDKRGEKAISLLDARILFSVDTLRAFLTELTPNEPGKGALTINDWQWGGKYDGRGLRVPNDNDYSDTSQHAHGTAIDAVSKHYTAEELRAFILDNRERFPYVTCLEGGVSWLHMDCRNLPESAPEGAIMIVYPNGKFEYK
ncbi:endolysin [Vibrio phage douglas 12A4]|uniref:endolysin n=1 Tax=Vibrio phage douglas 12A4 TaxID=573171 RepID=UPI0002C07E1C|nr:endolysin [Vibrio phage douglas 12A4]AGG58049.1 hypothetical protein VPAG_00013 [Vibrio phage douglas 12A4]